MKINTEIDGKSITITLTKEQLKEIQSQIPVKKWEDKLVQPDKENYYFICNGSPKGNGIYSLEPYIGQAGSKRKPALSFKTEQQAQLLADKCNLMIEMHNFAYAVNDEWRPNWTNEHQPKFGLTSHTGIIILNTYCLINDFIFGITVKSEELAKQMLQEFGARLERLYNQQY